MLMMTVLLAALRVHPRSLPEVSVQATVAVVLIVLNCCGKVMAISEFRVTGAGLAVKLKLTGSYCRLRVKVYCANWLISLLLVTTVMPMKACWLRVTRAKRRTVALQCLKRRLCNII